VELESPLIAVLAGIAGALLGFGADRLAVRWPEHDPEDAEHPAGRPLGWRTLVVVATSAIAFAATHNASGTVKAFDMQAGTLTLANGTEYMLPKDFKDPGLKAGDKVTIAWDTKDGNKVAEKVKIAK